MRSLRLSWPLSLLLSATLCLLPAAAQEDAEEESPYLPGLVARYSAREAQAVRLDESIAFDWGEGAPDPRLPAGAFQATWMGRLWTQVAGPHRLAAYVGGGKLNIKLGDREILAGDAAEPRWVASAPVELQFDRHPLTIQFEKTAVRAQLKLLWSGPGFGLEPIPARFLMHDRSSTVSSAFERGQRLAAALRCGACHGSVANREELRAPALDRLAGNVHSTWLVDWLSQEPKAARPTTMVRRMPHFGLTRREAVDVAAWLLREKSEKREQKDAENAEDPRNSKGKAKGAASKASADEGQRLFVTLGCLACHQHDELGESGLFGGGDLTKVAAKRPAEFFARWLADPAGLNRHHRMPTFELSSGERASLSLWLAASGAADNPTTGSDEGNLAAGQRLVERLRCASCHVLPGDSATKPPALAALSATSRWERSCAGDADTTIARPGYRLGTADQDALKAYYSTAVRAGLAGLQSRGRDLLVELNCLACHAREGIDRATNSLPATLQEKLATVVAIHDEFGKQVPAMTPPALGSVGDKLHDAALADAILRKGQPHRPYLMVQMPRFALSSEQLAALTAYFTATDRIPNREGEAGREGEAPAEPSPRPLVGALAAAGPRLVTTDGFGCTSCHQVGTVLPDKAPLNARGPSLSLLEKRIRREWFDRWCANPARIVPRMEMPSVQIPVRGVLGDNVHDQLAAVWHILNTPGFEPPEPNPVRVLRLSGVPERKEQPIVLHDVIKAGDKTYLFPLVIGLPNRHNILFDLETNRLAAWWLGDTARQRTKGKSWYWEAGSKSIFDPGFNESDVSIWIDGQERMPISDGQYLGELELISTNANTEVVALHRLSFVNPSGKRADTKTHRSVHLGQHFRLLDDDGRKIEGGFQRAVLLNGEGHMKQVGLRLTSRVRARSCTWDAASRTLTIPNEGVFIRVIRPPGVEWDHNGQLFLREDTNTPASNKYGIRNTVEEVDSTPRWQASVVLDYTSQLPVDRFEFASSEKPQASVTVVSIAPGFAGSRLPLSSTIMPTAFTWNAKRGLVFATLKGEVYRGTDTNGDSREDQIEIVADGLATPYGIHANEDAIDVAAKDGLIRLKCFDEGRHYDWIQTIASGWGQTDDYHDWAVGLVAGDNGEYYIGLPCQQDQRSEAAAKHRGQLLKLVPRKATPDNPRLFDIEVISSGHRFPMGLARNRDGELFVTDNQGNYNPFNELNHVRPGAHFGFINANEKERGYKPPRYDKPAIDIPHPWTRSVNGICFLDTPQALREQGKTAVFGPLEGHLIGCEYDTRQLIRMTLQKVGDTYQGAAYPLSLAPENVEDGLLGPIVCAVSPRGELYVGNIRDSGWGAGNNVGDIVQIKIEPDKLPCGIAEVRATQGGFTLDFFRPVDRAKASDTSNYSLASYRREPTPAYGGPNLERRMERIEAIDISPDAKRVTLRLAALRAGFLYEFQLKPLVRGKELFHPAEAHYTLNTIPSPAP